MSEKRDVTARRFDWLDTARLHGIFPIARVVWRISETFEAVGNWLEDLATATAPRSLRSHLRRPWRGETRV